MLYLWFSLFQLKQKLASATSAIKSVFGQEETKQDAVSLWLPFPLKQKRKIKNY